MSVDTGNTGSALGYMPQFGLAHLAALLAILAAGTAATLLARRARGSAEGTARAERWLRRFGWLLLIVALAWQLWNMLPRNWDTGHSLPLHFSDGLRIITALALITRAGLPTAVSFYWGLTLNLQAIVTPDLHYFTWPPLDYTLFWFFHGAALLGPVVLVWGLGYRPSWRGFGAAYAATALWSAFAFAVNLLLGTNYGYLNHAPNVPSLLDLLGPWPQYLLWEAVIVAAVWAAMTWPFTTARMRAGTRPIGRRGLMRRTVPGACSGVDSRV